MFAVRASFVRIRASFVGIRKLNQPVCTPVQPQSASLHPNPLQLTKKSQRNLGHSDSRTRARSPTVTQYRPTVQLYGSPARSGDCVRGSLPDGSAIFVCITGILVEVSQCSYRSGFHPSRRPPLATRRSRACGLYIPLARLAATAAAAKMRALCSAVRSAFQMERSR